MSQFVSALKKTKNFLVMAIPIIISVLLLIALVSQVVDFSKIKNIFIFNNFINAILGAVAGSLAAGNPITSYVLAGEFLKYGVHFVVVVAFVLTWVTVGIVQLPAEIVMLGKKFAILRNTLSFISAIFIALLMYVIL